MCIVVYEWEIILFYFYFFLERKILIIYVELIVDYVIKLILSVLIGIYDELLFLCIKSYELFWIVLFIISKENMF